MRNIGLVVALATLTLVASPATAEDKLLVDWNGQKLGPLDRAALEGLALAGTQARRLLRCPSPGDGGTLARGDGGTLAGGDGGTLARGDGGTLARGDGGTLARGDGGTLARGDGGTLPRCSYEPGGELAVGALRLQVGLVREASEHDGMYGFAETVVLVAPGEKPMVVAGVTQVEQSVVDCHTLVTLRRYALADLDGDGGNELCLERVEESGQGLFHVMALGKAGIPWLPIVSHRDLVAYALQGGALVPQPMLSSRCPHTGYQMFAEAQRRPDDAVASRLTKQGPRRSLEQCPLAQSEPCFELEECPGSGKGRLAVGQWPVPPAAPWGAPAVGLADGEPVGFRARVRVAGQKGTGAPVVVAGDSVLLWFELQNVSNRPQETWHCGFWPNHALELWGPNGQPVARTEEGRRRAAAFSPRGERGKNVRWEMAPGATDNTQGPYDLTELFTMRTPGLYLVQGRYEETVIAYSNALPIWVVPQPVKELLDQLNGWPKDECTRFENPSLDLRRKSTGETNGFLGSRKEQLAALGYTVVWSADAARYHFVLPAAGKEPRGEGAAHPEVISREALSSGLLSASLKGRDNKHTYPGGRHEREDLPVLQWHWQRTMHRVRG